MTEQTAKPSAEEEAAATTLTISVDGAKTILHGAISTNDNASSNIFFKGGPLRVFLGTNKAGDFSGSLQGQIGRRKADAEEGDMSPEAFENVDALVLFHKTGKNGDFFSGYVGGVEKKPGKGDVVWANIQPIKYDGEDRMTRKPVDVIDVTANLEGPLAKKLFDAIPVIQKPAATAEADAPEAKKPRNSI